MTFADTADRGVARHLTESVDGMSDQERAGTGARRSKRRFGSGVAAANHNNIVMLGVSDHCWGT